MTVIGKKKENYKGKCETREHAVGMRIARYYYAGHLRKNLSKKS